MIATGNGCTSTKYIPPPRRLNRVDPTPYPKKRQVTFQETPRQSTRPTPTHVVQQQKKPTITVNRSTGVADQKRNLNNQNHVGSNLKTQRTGFNFRPTPVFKTCNKCVFSGNHDKCVVKYLNYVNVKTTTIKHVVKPVKKVWIATGKVYTSVGYQWRPTGRKFTLGDMRPLNRNTSPKVVPEDPKASVLVHREL